MRKVILTFVFCISVLSAEELKPVISIDFEKGFAAETRLGTVKAIENGTPKLVPGRFGVGLESGPATGYLEYPHMGLIQGKEGAVEMWIKRVGWQPDDKEFHVFFETVNGTGWLVFYKFSAGSKVFMLSGQSRSGPYNIGPYTTGYLHRDTFASYESPQKWGEDWAHFVGVWSEDGNTTYMNGVPGKLHPTKQHHQPGNIDAGTRFRIGDHPWPVVKRTSYSLIDEVKIYDRALNDAEVLTLYNSSVFCNKAVPLDPELMSVTYSGDLDKKQLTVKINTGGAELDPETATVQCGLVATGTPTKNKKKFKLATPTEAAGDLPLPDAQGSYEIVIAIKDKHNQIEFRQPVEIPNFSWYGNTLGMQRKVLTPWTPVQVKGTTVKCWGREYRFNNSAFPEQIVTRDVAILAHPISIEADVDGQEVEWLQTSITKISADDVAAIFNGRMIGRAGDQEILVTTSVEIEYDGFALFNIQADQPQLFDNFALVIPLKEQHALYHHRYTTVREGCAGSVPEGTGVVDKTSFIPFAWLGDNDRGLFWCCESQQFWPNGEASDAYAEERSPGVVSMRLKLLAAGQRFQKNWDYQFALQATPVKPLPRNWRKSRFIAWENNEMRTWPGATIGYFNWGANNIASTMGYPKSSNPEIVREQIAATKAKGIKLLPYLNLSCQPTCCSEWAFFGKKWRMGYQDLDPVDIDRRHAYAAVSVGNKDYRDFVVWKLDRYMRKMKYEGQYHDNTFPYQSSLPESGCGYLRNGRRYPSFNILATRKLLQRNRAVLQAYDKNAFTLAHMSSKIWIPLLAYEDAMCDGEHFRGRIKDSYPKLLPMDMFRAEYMGRQWGVIPVMMSELSIENGKKIKPTRGLMTMLLLHDTKLWAKNNLNNRAVVVAAQSALDEFEYVDAHFIPYFDEKPPAVTDNKDVYVSAYKKADGAVLLIIGNVGAKTVDCVVTIDFDRLGIVPDKILDWPSKKVLEHQDNKLNVQVEGEGYVMVLLKNFIVPEVNLWGQ